MSISISVSIYLSVFIYIYMGADDDPLRAVTDGCKAPSSSLSCSSLESCDTQSL